MKNKRLIQPYSVPGCTAATAAPWEMQALNSALFHITLLTSTMEPPQAGLAKDSPQQEKAQR